jgi:four helix bundle protein
MHNLSELKIWQKAMVLAEEVYRITMNFPKSEQFGLVSQLRRAAVSVPSNISEGAGRNSDKEFNQFLGITNGSLNELLTQLILSEKLEFINKNEIDTLVKEIKELRKMICGMQKKLSSTKNLSVII